VSVLHLKEQEQQRLLGHAQPLLLLLLLLRA
jgi:hypothetical protein